MFTVAAAPILESPCYNQSTALDEQNADDCAMFDPSSGTSFDRESILLNTDLLDPECEAVLETMDSCVGCIEGVGKQHVYEEKMKEHALQRKIAVEQHELSEAEAAMIRLHLMEDRDDNIKQGSETALVSDLDILNLCGNDEDLDDAQGRFVIAGTNQAVSCSDYVDEDFLVRRDTAVRDGVAGQDLNLLQCAICFDEALSGNVSLNRVKFANLPCCGGAEHERNASFIKVCTSCILVLTTPSSVAQNRIGRCPRCFKWIKVKIPESTDKNVVTVEKVDTEGQCLICNQHKDHLVENNEVCDSCFLGRRQPLKYECQQCNCIQSIPHPMYRYQKREQDFGNVTWACQGKCGGFTNWKILPEEIHRIPLGDAPTSWGTDYIDIARRRVKILRADLVADKNAPKSPVEEDTSQCLVM